MNEATAILFDRLYDETAIYSSFDLKRQRSPTFGVLKQKGEALLPDIHEALVDDHKAALALTLLAEDITGQQPEIPEEDWGNIEVLIQAWVDYLDARANP